MTEPIIGLDPSLSATGVCTGSDVMTTIKTQPVDPRRMVTITSTLEQLCLGATFAAIEDLPTHAKAAGQTGMAQGVVRYWLQLTGVEYVTVSPATVKKFATGKGNATKSDMRMALYQRANLDVRDDNQVDARWLWEIAAHLTSQPTIRLPKTHTAALNKIGPLVTPRIPT